VVLHHELPPKPSSVTDLKEAMKSLKTETAQREARFKELMQAEKDKGKVLDRKFQELLKKAKDDPSTTPPPRDIDLE
jgi:predicted nuclease with TOPRIM domain